MLKLHPTIGARPPLEAGMLTGNYPQARSRLLKKSAAWQVDGFRPE